MLLENEFPFWLKSGLCTVVFNFENNNLICLDCSYNILKFFYITNTSKAPNFVFSTPFPRASSFHKINFLTLKSRKCELLPIAEYKFPNK